MWDKGLNNVIDKNTGLYLQKWKSLIDFPKIWNFLRKRILKNLGRKLKNFHEWYVLRIHFNIFLWVKFHKNRPNKKQFLGFVRFEGSIAWDGPLKH